MSIDLPSIQTITSQISPSPSLPNSTTSTSAATSVHSSSSNDISFKKRTLDSSTLSPPLIKRQHYHNSNNNNNNQNKPQPLELNLHSNADLALRIVSPGLPPLTNDDMKSTVRISQQIEQQQKHLIAARCNVKPVDSEELKFQHHHQWQIDKQSDKIDKPSTAATLHHQKPLPSPPTYPIYASDDSDLKRINEKKRKLKRDNIPSPLNIGPNHQNPSITSAPPIRTFTNYSSLSPPAPPPPMSLHKQPQSHHLPAAQITYSTLKPSKHLPSNTHINANTNQPRKPSHAQTINHAELPSTIKQQTNPVTDVFHGDFQKAAPLNSQPLSSQREFFETNVSLPTSTSTSKQRQLPKQSPIQLPYPYPIPQYLPINHHHHHHNFNSSKKEIFGSINFMNENIFNFKIFEKNTNTSTTSDESPPLSDEAEKKKFLKICETCWDEFVKAKS